MLVVHIDLSQPPHHGQLEILVIHGLVRSAGEGEAVGDLQPGVSDEAEEGALGDPAAAGASLQLMAVLDQLHDHQSVYLDNLETHHTLEILNGEFITHLNTGVILSVLTGVTTRVGHLQLSGSNCSSDILFVTLRVATQDNL